MRTRLLTVPLLAAALATAAAAPAPLSLSGDEQTDQTTLEVEEEDAPAPKVCDDPDEPTGILEIGDTSTSITAPSQVLGNETESLFFQVRLDADADAFDDTRGRVTVTMTWTVAANDYDLAVNGNESINFQPIDPAVEEASATLRHCDLVAITASDFLAPAPVEDLELDISVSRTN